MFSSTPIAQPFFDAEATESLTEDDFREHRVNDFVYNMGNNTVLIKWNPIKIPPVIEEMFPSPFTVDISLHSLDPETETHSYMGSIGRNVPNTGSFEVSLPSIDDPIMVVAVGISVSETSVSEVVNDDAQGDGNQDDITIKDIVNSIKKIKKFIKNPLQLLPNIIDIGFDAATRLGCEAYCNFVEPENIGDKINDRLPPCPPTSDRARRDRQFTRENPFLEYFTVGTIGQCYAQNVFDRYAHRLYKAQLHIRTYTCY